MERKLGIAGLQLKKDFKDQTNNITNFIKIAKKTKSIYPWVDLIFTGELYLQKYGYPTWKSEAQEIPNEITDKVSDLAKNLNCWIIPGSFLEREDSSIYNTLLIFDPNGKIISKYRKIFPWAPFEDTNWGLECVTFDIPHLGRIGVSICYDLWFPEVFRTLTWMGAEVIIQPSLTYTPDRQAELILSQAQAIMFQCYFLNINCLSDQGGGDSIFVDPEGRILQTGGANENILLEIIDFDKVTWIREFGSFGLNQVWKNFRDSKIQGKFPPYFNLQSGEVFKNLSTLRKYNNPNIWDEIK